MQNQYVIRSDYDMDEDPSDLDLEEYEDWGAL